MKSSTSILALLVCAFALLVSVPGRAAEDPAPEFREKVAKAASTNAKVELAKLVKAEPAQAVVWTVRLGEEFLERQGEEEARMLAALAEAWKSTFKGEFGVKTEEYYTTLDGQKRKDRAELKTRFAAMRNEYEGNLEVKDGLTFGNIVEEAEVIGFGFEEVGDEYHCAQTWMIYATSYDEELRRASADLHRAYNGYDLAVAAFERLDLKDQDYQRALKRRDELHAKGWHEKRGPAPSGGDGGGAGEPGAGEAGGDAGGAAAPAPADLGPPIAVPLAFEVLPSVDAFARPCFNADEVYEIWASIGLAAKGSKATFPYCSDAPQVVRVGSSDLRLDRDGDGKGDGEGDEKLQITGSIAPLQLRIGRAETERPWAVFTATGIQKDTYQGIEMNLEPDGNQYAVYTLGAATVVGTLEGVRVRVIDDFMDGVYGSKVQTWGNVGLTNDNFQAELDSVVIGESKRARPWSDVQEVGGKWYRMSVDAAGKTLEARPIAPRTGVLKLEFKGPAPSWVVVRGATPETADSLFDLVEGGAKGVVVPVGNYQLAYGEIRKGKKKQTQKVVIVPPRAPPTYTVKEGATTVVKLGGPFDFDFRYSLEGEALKIEGRSVAVVGAAGERYERAWNCVARPEVSWRKAGTKKASKAEKMPIALSNEIVNELGWPAPWFPLDLELEARDAGGAVEVQLVDKKHELFGKVESTWK